MRNNQPIAVRVSQQPRQNYPPSNLNKAPQKAQGNTFLHQKLKKGDAQHVDRPVDQPAYDLFNKIKMEQPSQADNPKYTIIRQSSEQQLKNVNREQQLQNQPKTESHKLEEKLTLNEKKINDLEVSLTTMFKKQFSQQSQMIKKLEEQYKLLTMLNSEQTTNKDQLEEQFFQLKQNQEEQFRLLQQQFQSQQENLDTNQESQKNKPSKESQRVDILHQQITKIEEELKLQKNTIQSKEQDLLNSEIQKLKECIQTLNQNFALLQHQYNNIIDLINNPKVHNSLSQIQKMKTIKSNLNLIFSDKRKFQSQIAQGQQLNAGQEKNRFKTQIQNQSELKELQQNEVYQFQSQQNQLLIEKIVTQFENIQQPIIEKFEKKLDLMLINLVKNNETQIQKIHQDDLEKIIKELLPTNYKLLEEKLLKMTADLNVFKNQIKEIEVSIRSQQKISKENKEELFLILQQKCSDLDQQLIKRDKHLDNALQEIRGKVNHLSNEINSIQQIQAQKQTFNENQSRIQSQQEVNLNNSKMENRKLQDTPKKQQETLKTEKYKKEGSQLISQNNRNNKSITQDDQLSNFEDQFQQYQVEQPNFQEIDQSPFRQNLKNRDLNNLKTVQDLINDIYNLTCRKRSAQGDFRKFIRDEQNIAELYYNYGIKQSQIKRQLAQICNSFRQVRGDGNCFYTAFGFQFLDILFNKYSQDQYQQFIMQMDKIISFKIIYNQEKSIESKQLQQKCWNELKFRLEYFRNQKNQQEFIKHFQAYEQSQDDESIDGCFYGLSTIFFRNLANYLVDQSELKAAVQDQENLLIWEEECNSNEVVIQELSKYLQVHVKLLFFDQGSYYVREYSEGMPYQIILLIKPGHYNLGYLNKIQQNIQ